METEGAVQSISVVNPRKRSSEEAFEANKDTSSVSILKTDTDDVPVSFWEKKVPIDHDSPIVLPYTSDQMQRIKQFPEFPEYLARENVIFSPSEAPVFFEEVLVASLKMKGEVRNTEKVLEKFTLKLCFDPITTLQPIGMKVSLFTTNENLSVAHFFKTSGDSFDFHKLYLAFKDLLMTWKIEEDSQTEENSSS